MAFTLNCYVVVSITRTLSITRVPLTLTEAHPVRTRVITLALLADVLTLNMTVVFRVGRNMVNIRLSTVLLSTEMPMGQSYLYIDIKKDSVKEEQTA